MTFEIQMQQILKDLLQVEKPIISKAELLSCVDLTLLIPDALPESYITLQTQAEAYQVAALCVYPEGLPILRSKVSFPLATVVNFPQGVGSFSSIAEKIKQAKELGAAEIDYVFPYQAYLEGNTQEALAQSEHIISLCKQLQLTSKIILETGAFSSPEDIYQVAQTLANQGWDYLKTSTGKITQGASIPAAYAILTALKDSKTSCGIKISGGIKSLEQALSYAQLAEYILDKKIHKGWFRIGASQLI